MTSSTSASAPARPAAHANPLLIGISGPSSSGKTTLSRLLRDIFPSTSILHEDDFYKPDADIPVNAAGVADWDCLESLDLPLLTRSLEYIKRHGSLPPDLQSKEDSNSVGESRVDAAVVQDLRARAREVGGETRPIIIIDGFLLFSEEMKHIRSLFDVKLFLRADYATAKRRREARSGYVTLEGFWQDPPGYVDQVVWPNYVKDHAFLFCDRDVEGEVDDQVCSNLGINPMPREAAGNMTKCVKWAHEILARVVEA